MSCSLWCWCWKVGRRWWDAFFNIKFNFSLFWCLLRTFFFFNSLSGCDLSSGSISFLKWNLFLDQQIYIMSERIKGKFGRNSFKIESLGCVASVVLSDQERVKCVFEWVGGKGIEAEHNGTERLCGHNVLGCVRVMCSLDNRDEKYVFAQGAWWCLL